MCVRRADNCTTKTGSNVVVGKRRQQNAVVRVNGVLLAFLHTGSVVGSLTGSLIIGSGQLPGGFSPASDVSTWNVSVDNGTVDISVCGVNHCPFIAEHIKAFASPDPHLVFVVGAVFLLCVVAATVLTLVLRPLPSDRPCCPRDHNERGGTVSLRKRIVGTLRLLANTRLLLLIPTIIMMGVITSFAIGAFNQVQNNIVAYNSSS